MHLARVVVVKSIKDVMEHNMLEKEWEDPFIRLVRIPEVHNNR